MLLISNGTYNWVFPLKQLVDGEEMARARDRYGRVPLHLAVLYGRERFVRYLLLLFPSCVGLLDKVRDGRSETFTLLTTGPLAGFTSVVAIEMTPT